MRLKGSGADMSGYVLALDQGTTSSRAILFDEGGQVVASRQRELPQSYPQPGWVEHDPEAIWETQLAVAREVIAAAQVTTRDIVALGITNQRETTLIWDRATGTPIAPAIVWQDRRTAPDCDALRAAGLEATIREKTGLVLDAYFSATKIRWLLGHIPDARARAERGELAFGTVDSFLIWRLTNGARHVTDVTNASRTMLLNIHTGQWDDDLLHALDVPRALLPEVLPSSGRFGETSAALLGGAIPITGVAGDQHAATFGQACFTPGMAKNTYGTGCFLLMNTGTEPKPSPGGLLTTVAWAVRGSMDGGHHAPASPPGFAPRPLAVTLTYALEGSVFVSGAAVQWLRDALGLIASAAEAEPLAASVPDTGGVYLVPAFAGLGAPYWDAYARGALVGLTRGSGRAQIVRATLEATAYQTRDVLDVMRQDSGIPVPRLRVDGGMTVNDFLMQFQADILGIPVERPRVTETTALGAAYLAGLAVAYWPDLATLAANAAVERVFEPHMSADERDTRYAGWQHAVAQARA